MPTVSILNTTANVSGKTLLVCENPHTISGLVTFSRSPSAPFAVAAGSAVVANLDADKIDGYEATALAVLAENETISGTWTFTNQVTLNNGATLDGHLLFTDATFDIGASGATRPRDLFLSRNAVIGGTLGVTGVVTLTAQAVLNDGATLDGHLLFTDATFDIGASGATRPRDLYLSRNALIGGTLTVTGVSLLAAGTVGAVGLGIGAADAGLYSSGSDALDFATAGTKALGIDATQFIDSPTQPRVHCLATSISQSINDATETAVQFDEESFDVGGLHDTVTNNTRLTVPTGGDGLYLIYGTVQFVANGTGNRRATVVKNGTTRLGGGTIIATAGASVNTQVPVMTVAVLAATDYVELYAYQNSGGPLNISDSASPGVTSSFGMVKLW